MLAIDQLNRTTIDAQIALLNHSQLIELWQLLLDARSVLPPNERFVELKDMLENHVIPVAQAFQGIDVVAHRAETFVEGTDQGSSPLSPIVLELVNRARGSVHTAPVAAALPTLEKNLEASVTAMLNTSGAEATRKKLVAMLNGIG
jgi:hypothetical protein